ncbi:hypothetical protein ACFCX7_25720 [Streptomyces microflavus]|uniref:hypothetical protein n=1 Tax=Streptomyces microflavus TaxID=1919 RepID=UPI0035DA8142
MNDVPALLPEIWLHWDPKTLRQRGARAMQNLRMDFLMLLPGTRRVVLEVDGMQHYTRNGGTEPDSAQYAATMAGDRDLKFRGYEVFPVRPRRTPRQRASSARARRLLRHAP